MPYQSGTISLELTPNINEAPFPIHIYEYDAMNYIELKFRNWQDLPDNLLESSHGKNMWIEICSTDIDLIRNILIYFDVHPFVIDDIRTLDQRMKMTVLNEDIYMLLSLIYLHSTNEYIEQQQITFYLMENILITIQEYRADSLFSTIKHRLSKKPNQSRGRTKKSKIDYLFYCLLNEVIENYVAVLDSILHETEYIDKELMFSTRNKVNTLRVETLKLMFHIKHDLFHFKVVCAPLKDLIIKLQKTRETLVPKRQRPALRQCRRRLKRRLRHAVCQTRSAQGRIDSDYAADDEEYLTDDGLIVLNDYIYKYFKRLLDHTVQLNDTIDSYTDIIISLIDFYMILNGDLINRTMKTLTTMSCIFMPLNFLSSLSSMNFEYMPQIPLHFGYFGQVILMGLLGFLMVMVFKLKNIL